MTNGSGTLNGAASSQATVAGQPLADLLSVPNAIQLVTMLVAVFLLGSISVPIPAGWFGP